MKSLLDSGCWLEQKPKTGVYGCRFFSFLLTVLRKRKLVSKHELRDDLPKLGVIWVGAGVVVFVVNDNTKGIVPFAIGLVLLYFGLTQSKDKQTLKDNTDEDE